jgi:hypothetical protein
VWREQVQVNGNTVSQLKRLCCSAHQEKRLDGWYRHQSFQ